MLVVDDLAALDAGVDGRNSLQRVHHCPDKEGHEAELDAVPLPEALAVPTAQLDHCGHVGLVESRQQGGLLLGLDEVARDDLSKRRHGHAFLGGSRGRLGRRGSCWSFVRGCRLRRGHCGWRGFGLGPFHGAGRVLLEHPAPRPRALRGRSWKAGFTQHAARAGHHPGRGLGRCGWRRRGSFGLNAVSACGGGLFLPRRSLAGLDQADHVARHRVFAFLLQDLDKRASHRAGQFDGGLVGLDFDGDLVQGEVRALGFAPRPDADFRDRFAGLGN